LIAEQTLSSSTVLDRLGPDVHHLAADLLPGIPSI
jgi:hypothetical protein